MGRKGQSITLSVSEREKTELEKLAHELGMTWGDKPNISKLIKAIASRKLLIAPNHDWTRERIQALDKIRKFLIDEGDIEQATVIAKLLQERSELTLPFRAEIESFLNHPQPAWRKKIDNFIYRQQPFRLSYEDAAERQWNYTVLSAQIMPIEKRQYLVCRCLESEGNMDIPELCHNWTLRLDRIQEAAVIAVTQPWAKDLEKIPVEFHLYEGLAFGYKSDNSYGDVEVSEIFGDRPTKKVVRNIYSTYWFFRDIAKYWENCQIISPNNVRELFQDKVRRLSQQYGITDREEFRT